MEHTDASKMATAAKLPRISTYNNIPLSFLHSSDCMSVPLFMQTSINMRKARQLLTKTLAAALKTILPPQTYPVKQNFDKHSHATGKNKANTIYIPYVKEHC